MTPQEEEKQLLVQRRVYHAVRPMARFDVGPPPMGVEGPVILAANHRSLADLLFAAALYHLWGWPVRSLVAAAYFEKPGVGSLLRGLGCIPVSGREAVERAAEILAEGTSVAIMPEGRVVRPEEWQPTGVGEARTGVGRLALESKRPVIAVGAAGTEVLWPRKSTLPRVRPGRRPLLVARHEVIGVVENLEARVALEKIWEGVRRQVNLADQVRKDS